MVSSAGFADVTTLYEGGPTVPVGHYLASLFEQEPLPRSSDKNTTRAAALPVTFPVITASMRPGRLESSVRLRTAGWLAAPMFIVGDDTISKQWLVTNRASLLRSGAAGLVVNAATFDGFRALRALAPDVPMAPGAIEDFASQAGLSVYPLFVSIDGLVSQQVP